ncbi:hypothetical protein SynBIOSU31_01073 [Synechococcus sp. BIOS-U3-1]|nr:hypothetical protein SynBIOSU31_01073 [Synechococcus sp. BIOS-U3-1]
MAALRSWIINWIVFTAVTPISASRAEQVPFSLPVRALGALD